MPKKLKTKYDNLKVDVLRGLLALRDLPTTGKKDHLTMRLFQDDSSEDRIAALGALQQHPTVLNPSPDRDPEQDSDQFVYPRQNHTSYYESLSIAQLVYHLHERALSVCGDQEELVERLREYDWEGSDSGYSESDDEEETDHTASFYHRTITHQSFYYDGKGLHPSILIGLRIQGFFYDPEKGLQLRCDRGRFNISFCGWPWPTSVGLPERADFRLRLDKVLRNGLRSVQELNEQGLSKGTDMDKREKRGHLLIVGAVVAVRKSIGGDYRVLGLQCEGMSTVGYVYVDDKESYRVKQLGLSTGFYDVGLEGKKGQ
ncbi:MAG: hypothetical protein ASARMPRED_006279 [Alectoria sarmentosa]|nr:MAG: hypothetical protein ASARMPRED_006279 [Alectoria sarmentosa]